MQKITQRIPLRFKVLVIPIVLLTVIATAGFEMMRADVAEAVSATVKAEVEIEAEEVSIVNALLAEAKNYLGTPYNYGGKSPAGFDCSGFTYFIFDKFDIEIPRSSRNQVSAGNEVPYEEAQPGDLIVFTGTDASTGRAGHVGIVVENEGGISFIHSSSNGGVKVSEVEGTGYQKRFLQVRRVIE